MGGREQAAGGDIVLEAEGQAAVWSEVLQRIVFAQGAGDAERLSLWRDGIVRDLDVTLRPPLRPATDDGPTEPAR